MNIRYLLAPLCLLPLAAHGEIYKAVDKEGHVTYSSAPIKGGKKIILEPLPTMLPLGRARSPEDFPRVDGDTQKSRDDTRRKILLDELNSEQNALAESKQKLTELEAENRGDAAVGGKHIHNEVRYNEYIKNIKDQNDVIESHNKNIEALKTELSKIK
jgi:Domain of unknown function (DUF4124)